MAWARFTGDKWTPVNVSNNQLVFVNRPFADIGTGYAFRCQKLGNSIKVIGYGRKTVADLEIRVSGEVLDIPSKLTSQEIWNYQFNDYLISENGSTGKHQAYGNQLGRFEHSQDLETYGPGTVLIMNAEIWIKAKDSNGTEGYALLKSEYTNKYRSWLYLEIDGIEMGMRPYRAVIWNNNYSVKNHNLGLPALKVWAQVDIPSINKYYIRGQQLPIAETASGSKRELKLKLVIEPTTLPLLSDLGIESKQDFTPLLEFKFENPSRPFLESASPAEIEITKLRGGEIYSNGYRGGINTFPISFANAGTDRVLGALTAPYKVSSPDNPTDSFWLLSSPSSNSNYLGEVWYYSDYKDACFIDAQPNTPGIWSAGYTEANLISNSFAVGREKFISIENSEIYFSSDDLPKVDANLFSSELDKQVWDKQVKGDMGFDLRLPYACYNWEIFFHAPLMIADQLSKQQKFEEAEHWLRYIFDPTSTEPGTDAKRFLKFGVFKEPETFQEVIDDLTALAQTASGYYTTADTQRVSNLITRWRERPFRPFVIARGRHIAFLWRTLFSYLDNLLAWADSAYRRDTRESINEALMLYALAMKILGRKPAIHSGKSKKSTFTFNDFIGQSGEGQWDEFANFWIDVGARQSQYLGNRVWANLKDIVSDKPRPTSAGMLAFCMPFNDKILSYWNIVESRLFNIRHCRNIEGIERNLPLSDPPIDPELLVRATAAGLDLGAVIAGLYAPPPHYRYSVLASRATELANDVKSLGSALLSALEKKDAESLALLRSSNEINLLKLVSNLRQLQISEAEKNLDALRASRRSTATRFAQYQRLLGKKDVKVPAEGETLGDESMLGVLDEGLASGRSSLGLIYEENQVYTGIKAANDWSTAANITKLAASFFHFGEAVALAIPDPGEKTAKALKATGQGTSLVGDGLSFISQAWRAYADQQSMLAGHLRRRDEWAFQSNQTLKELQQIDKQILANQIRIEITKKELSNHIEQIEQAQAVDEVMRSKFTNQQLYEWMSRELFSLYDKAYRLALDTARKAEKAAERELGFGSNRLNIIGNNHWDSMKQGLLAGERLYHDLKRLEMCFIDQNRREYELTKHISLRRLDPEALVKLRITQDGPDGNKINQCEFEIPEWLLDLDTPGHYLRRIKSVSVSIPCVVGPYSSVHCKLTMLKSSLRHEPDMTSVLEDTFGNIEAVVTSTANADSGMFETSLRDERFLPFEGRGVISTWRLELPAQFKQFDYSTISDVILTVRYTARDGGTDLRNAAEDKINKDLNPPAGSEPLFLPVLISCKADFPTEWARASEQTDLEIRVTKNFLPYWINSFEFQEFKRSDIEKSSNSISYSAFTVVVCEPSEDKTTATLNLGKLKKDEVVDRLLLIRCKSWAN